MLEITNLTKKKVCQRSLKKIAEAFLREYKIKEAEISLVFIGDKRSRTLNKKYRNKDSATDVLSFSNPNFNLNSKSFRGANYFSAKKNLLVSDNFLGEIFINLAEVSRLNKYQEMFLELEGLKGNSKVEDLSLVRNLGEPRKIKLSNTAKLAQKKYLLNFIFIHGLLHLVGFNDEEVGERKKMLNLGLKFLENLNNRRI